MAITPKKKPNRIYMTDDNSGVIYSDKQGNVISKDEAMKHFSYTLDCTIVFLDTPYDVICKRLGDWSTRGIVVPPGNTLKTLYNQRWDLYKYYADVHVKETELNDILARVSEEIEVL